MPRAKKTTSSKSTRKSTRRASVPSKTDLMDSESSAIMMDPATSTSSNQFSKLLNSKLLILLILVALLVLVAYRNRGLFLAATVNGGPITRLELDRRLESRYGSQTLDEIVNEKLITDEANKRGMKASDSEISAKIDEVTARLGDKSKLADALSQQGMTMDDLKNQIKLQVLVEKLTAGSVNVSDDDIAKYIDTNKSSMTATDEAGLKAEALNALTTQKKNEAFQKWFTDLKARAKVTKYL